MEYRFFCFRFYLTAVFDAVFGFSRTANQRYSFVGKIKNKKSGVSQRTPK
jgi:hypothetical protein